MRPTKVRAIVGPKVAIGAEFDLHCHLSALMLDSADVLIGYKEYPHTDTMERAAELFAIIADTVEGKVKPVMARHDCRMIAQYRTSVPPISEFVTRMKSLEGKDGILSVSLSHGFSFADVEDVDTPFPRWAILTIVGGVAGVVGLMFYVMQGLCGC